jgi:hypothetical protein
LVIGNKMPPRDPNDDDDDEEEDDEDEDLEPPVVRNPNWMNSVSDTRYGGPGARFVVGTHAVG